MGSQTIKFHYKDTIDNDILQQERKSDGKCNTNTITINAGGGGGWWWGWWWWWWWRVASGSPSRLKAAKVVDNSIILKSDLISQ